MGNLHGHFKYGQRFYDFKEGGLCFVSPNQAIANYDVNEGHSGYMLLVHPDFLLNYPLMRKIKQYGFFSYAVDEALHFQTRRRQPSLLFIKTLRAN